MAADNEYTGKDAVSRIETNHLQARRGFQWQQALDILAKRQAQRFNPNNGSEKGFQMAAGTGYTGKEAGSENSSRPHQREGVPKGSRH